MTHTHTRRALLCAAALLAACQWSTIADPPLDPSLALVDVQTHLSEAATLGAEDSAAATDSWIRAHDRFQRDLEPLLRERVGAVPVAKTEYAFGRMLHTLQTDGPTLEHDAHELQTSLSDLAGKLTPTVAAR